MNLKPLHNNILIEVIKEKKTTYGLILTEFEIEKVGKGYVKAVGPGFYDFRSGLVKPLSLKFGDCVIFNKQVSIEFVDSGISYVLVSEDNVYGIIF